jgi:hypothetical protein
MYHTESYFCLKMYNSWINLCPRLDLFSVLPEISIEEVCIYTDMRELYCIFEASTSLM